MRRELSFTIRILFAVAFLFARGQACALAAGESAALPRLLSDTGLYVTGSMGQTRSGLAAFSPQYPLWSDGADKRRWLSLPPGTSIDASKPDVWVFPPGTRLWKEFAFEGRPVETRYIERGRDGQWRFASYVWNEAGTDAVLAPATGIAALPVSVAPQGRYTIPSRTDCLACHTSTSVPVLGFTALQLSPDRDPLAVGAKPVSAGEQDLRSLVARGWLRGLPATLLESPPRIPAPTAIERAALGYLHGNCAHCHNTTGQQVPVRLTLEQRVADSSSALQKVLHSAVDATSRYRPLAGDGDPVVVWPGQPERSLLIARMQSRNPQTQMPPLGTAVPDAAALALIQRWIADDLIRRKGTSP